MPVISKSAHPFLPTEPLRAFDDADFLLFVGHKVREARSRRGMTRKMLAQDADVSERHLAQLELGEGNVSIVLLRRITNALNIPLADVFLVEKPSSSSELALSQILDRIPPQRIEAVIARLQREFGADDSARRGRIALIGLRGAGKSTLGSKLAKHLNVPFVELDQKMQAWRCPRFFRYTGKPDTAASKRKLSIVSCCNMIASSFQLAVALSLRKKPTTNCWQAVSRFGSRHIQKNICRA